MASLSPRLTATPSAAPTYNVGMAETFSWIPVEGAGRPLFARTMYLANPEDIKVSLSADNLSVGIDTTDVENLIIKSNTLLNVLTADTYSIENFTNSIDAYADAIDQSILDTNTKLNFLTAVDYATKEKQDSVITLLNALTAKETSINLDVSAININTNEVEGLIKNSNTLLNELTAKPITDVSGIETKLNALTSVQFATSTNQLNTNNLLNSLTALQETKQGQIITLLNAITGMSIDVDLTTDQINLNTDQVETLLNDLTGTNIKVPGFSIPPYTEINLSYYGTTNNLASVSYINNSTTVLNLSFSYATNPPTTNDALLTNVKKV